MQEEEVYFQADAQKFEENDEREEKIHTLI